MEPPSAQARGAPEVSEAARAVTAITKMASAAPHAPPAPAGAPPHAPQPGSSHAANAGGVTPQQGTSDSSQDEAEPSLKYEPLGGDISREVVGGGGAAPSGDSITCLCVSEKFLALGTARGKVHILDYCANQVRRVFRW